MLALAHLCPADGAVPPQGWQAEAGQPQPVRAAFQLPCRQVLPHPGPPHAQTGLAALQGSHPARPPDCQPAGPPSALLGGPEVPPGSRSFTWSRPSCVRRESASGRVTRPRLGVQPTALTGRTRVADAEAWSVGPQPPRSQYPPLPKAPIVALDGRLAMSDCPNCSPPCHALTFLTAGSNVTRRSSRPSRPPNANGNRRRTGDQQPGLQCNFGTPSSSTKAVSSQKD